MKAKSDRTYHGLVGMEKESAGNGFLNLEKREEERHGAGVSQAIAANLQRTFIPTRPRFLQRTIAIQTRKHMLTRDCWGSQTRTNKS